MTEQNERELVPGLYPVKMALNIEAGVSPWMRGPIPEGSSPEQIAAAVQAEINESLRRHFPTGNAWQDVKVTAEAYEDKPLRVVLEELHNALAENASPPMPWEDPHDGVLGWWRVEGIRHSAIVRASSAEEAVNKSSDVVGSWESGVPTWIGEELPDVIGC